MAAYAYAVCLARDCSKFRYFPSENLGQSIAKVILRFDFWLDGKIIAGGHRLEVSNLHLTVCDFFSAPKHENRNFDELEDGSADADEK